MYVEPMFFRDERQAYRSGPQVLKQKYYLPFERCWKWHIDIIEKTYDIKSKDLEYLAMILFLKSGKSNTHTLCK